ncbi:MAG: hypothetical protein WB902_19120 [Acetobacteraceae bacterium]
MRSPPGLSAAALAACVLITVSVAVGRPAQTQDGKVALGANAESLLAAARQPSPTLEAAALGTRAAGARADAAGALPDPTFMINDDEVDRTGGPRINKTYYLFGQTFPLWGKIFSTRPHCMRLKPHAGRNGPRATSSMNGSRSPLRSIMP